MMTLESSPDKPQPLRAVSDALAQYIRRLGPIWVEGEVTQVNPRTGGNLAYFGLRDLEEEVSISAAAERTVLAAVTPALSPGARVVVWGRVEFWKRRGNIQFRAGEIRPVGIGDLLARIERLKRDLAAEGLFRPERKRPLPFLPGLVGLVCGRGSAAERDVVENACRRWPAVRFEIREVPVQGARAAADVAAAVRELDADARVEVIVVTRGGGSVEDLLPFSDEALVRTISSCATPVISAVGHEQDQPLIDLVADVRASTPTDAARRVVPDVEEQAMLIARLEDRQDRAVLNLVESERLHIDQLLRRPVLAEPSTIVERHRSDLIELARRSARELALLLTRTSERLHHDRARLAALSPQGTLDRGYAIVSTRDSYGVPAAIVRDAADVTTGNSLHVQVSVGSFNVLVDDDRGEA